MDKLQKLALHFPRTVGFLPLWFPVTGKIKAEVELGSLCQKLNEAIDKLLPETTGKKYKELVITRDKFRVTVDRTRVYISQIVGREGCNIFVKTGGSPSFWETYHHSAHILTDPLLSRDIPALEKIVEILNAEIEDRKKVEALCSELDRIVFSKKEAPSFSKAKEEIQDEAKTGFKFLGEQTLEGRVHIDLWHKEANVVVIYTYPKSPDGSTTSIVFYGEDKNTPTLNPDVRRLAFDENGKLLYTIDVVKTRVLERKFNPDGNIACARLGFGCGQGLKRNYKTQEGWVFTSSFGQEERPLTRHDDLTLKQMIGIFGPVKVHSSDPELSAILEHPWERPKPQNETEAILDEMMYKFPPTLSETLAQIKSKPGFRMGLELGRTEGMPTLREPNTIVLFGGDKIGFYDAEGRLFRKLEFDEEGRMSCDWRNHIEGDKEYIYYMSYWDHFHVYRVHFARLVLITKNAEPDRSNKNEYIESYPGEGWIYRKGACDKGRPLKECEFEMAQEFIGIFGSGEIRG